MNETDLCKSISMEISCKAMETQDDFIFTTIAKAFGEDKELSKITMSKEILTRALRCFYQEHTDEYYKLLDESKAREKENADETTD